MGGPSNVIDVAAVEAERVQAGAQLTHVPQCNVLTQGWKEEDAEGEG